ncbi:hypothetical protein [Pseudonocardia humida]|uniref:Uncharacterized protein n=1 Tax=Pseudonocardia humida TaxID=2800819 RepID=A0ABT0ZVX7_9PSEU|nr:hypothetical protein [Pseudonocardia humida]MCO1654895.1 hypothetical protein [Pseudonocardia humida]
MADLLSRHGHVLRDDPEVAKSTKVEKAAEAADGTGPRAFPARWRRTLIVVGCVVVAGSVLGGAVAVGNAGYDAPLGPVPGGLLDQLTRGSTGVDGGTPPTAHVLPQDVAGRQAPGMPLPRTAGVAPAAGVVPAPRAPGPAERTPAPVVAPPPVAGGVAPTDRAGERTAPAPAVGPAVAPEEPERDTRSEAPAPDAVDPAPAAPETAAPAPAPAEPSGSGGGAIGGLLGGVTDTVGGLLGG